MNYLPHVCQPGGFQCEEMKQLLRTFSCPENRNMIPNFLFQTNMENPNHQKEGRRTFREDEQTGGPLPLTEDGEISTNQYQDTSNSASDHCLQVPCSPYCVQGVYTLHPHHRKLYRYHTYNISYKQNTQKNLFRHHSQKH